MNPPYVNHKVDAEKTKGDLPRKFEKLTQICATPKKGFKANDIYKLMFNRRIYEVAWTGSWRNEEGSKYLYVDLAT